MDRRLLAAALVTTSASALLGGWIAARDALANGAGLPDTIAVALKPGDTTDLGIEANFGFLDAADGVNFTWICHDVLVPSGASTTPAFFRNSDGAFLATVRSLGIANNPNVSIYFSTDGCDWAAASGVDNLEITGMAFDPATPSHALAVSAHGATTPVPNGIFVSSDAGHSWTATSLVRTQRFFRTVRFAPSDPLTVYATANWFSPTSAWVYSSSNGGVTWAEHDWTFTGTGTVLQSNIDVAAISPTNARVVYVRTDGADDVLLRSTDGGTTFAAVHTSAHDDLRSTIYEFDGGAVWTAAKLNGTFRSTDGVNFSPIPTTTPIPQIRGLASDPRGVFVVANNYSDGFALARTNDGGASFTPLFHFNELKGARACPAGSDVAQICAPLFPALAQSLGIATPTPSATPAPPAKKNCSCDLAPAGVAPVAGSALVALFALTFVRRRARD